MANRASALDLEDASASSAQDKTMICKVVSELLGSFDNMNNLLRQKVFAMLTSMGEHFFVEQKKVLLALTDGDPMTAAQAPVLSERLASLRAHPPVPPARPPVPPVPAVTAGRPAAYIYIYIEYMYTCI